MDETPLLKLPYILAAQSQKHVTHNEALRVLDAVVQLAVEDKDLSTPPGSPAEGARYIVSASPTGAWAGHATHVAAWQDGAWAFYTPVAGWLAWVHDESQSYLFSGGGWIPAPGGGGGSGIVPKGAWSSTETYVTGDLVEHEGYAFLSNIDDNLDNEPDADTPGSTAEWTYFAIVTGGGGGGGGGDVNPVPLVGVNATADTANRLSVSSPASLFSHEGTDHRLKINKAAAGDTASVLFQTGFSGRAEFGLAGDDDWHVKVSPDGSTWHEAIVVNRSTGSVSFPNTAGGGGGGGTPPGYGELLTSLSLLALQVADLGNVALFIGASGNRVYDSFDDLAHVDVAGATNLDASMPGVLRPTSSMSPISQAAGTNIGDMTGAGGLAAAFDGNTDQSSGNSAFKGTASNAYIGKSHVSTVGKAVVYGSNNNGYVGTANPNVTLNLRGKIGAAPSNRSDGDLLGTISFADTSNESTTPREIINSLNPSTVYDHRWIELIRDDGSTANGLVVTELTFHDFVIQDMEVASAPFPAAAAPSAMKGLVLVRETGATANTDYGLAFSRDGGTTWDDAALSVLFTMPDGTAVAESNEVDVSGQPSGTSPCWRFSTGNGKFVKLHAAALYWS